MWKCDMWKNFFTQEQHERSYMMVHSEQVFYPKFSCKSCNESFQSNELEIQYGNVKNEAYRFYLMIKAIENRLNCDLTIFKTKPRILKKSQYYKNKGKKIKIIWNKCYSMYCHHNSCFLNTYWAGCPTSRKTVPKLGRICAISAPANETSSLLCEPAVTTPCAGYKWLVGLSYSSVDE